MDPYKILGVSKEATDEEIKQVYRKLSKKYHPDLNAGSKEAEKKFKEIGQAFELISNKEAREKHSQAEDLRTSSQHGAGFSGSRPFYHETQAQNGRYNTLFEDEYEDILASLFRQQASGHKRTPSQKMTGADTLYTMEISVEEAIHGSSKQIVLPNGKQLIVKIPKGIQAETKLRFKEQGELGIKQAGDAYIKIQLKSSKRYTIEGLDLVSELPINLDEAINGTEIEFQTIEGLIRLKIPAGANSDTKLKIKGKGLINPDQKNRGDQYVGLKVVLPPKVDPELSQFIKQWQKTHPYNPRAEVS